MRLVFRKHPRPARWRGCTRGLGRVAGSSCWYDGHRKAANRVWVDPQLLDEAKPGLDADGIPSDSGSDRRSEFGCDTAVFCTHWCHQLATAV